MLFRSYGIEINDFAVSVAQTALWIAESQMLKKTEDIIGASLDYFPLKSNTNIREGNALRMDWDEIFSKKNNIVPPPPKQLNLHHWQSSFRRRTAHECLSERGFSSSVWA